MSTPFDIVVSPVAEVRLYLGDGSGTVVFQRDIEDWERNALANTVEIEIPRSDIQRVIAHLQKLMESS